MSQQETSLKVTLKFPQINEEVDQEVQQEHTLKDALNKTIQEKFHDSKIKTDGDVVFYYDNKKISQYKTFLFHEILQKGIIEIKMEKEIQTSYTQSQFTTEMIELKVCLEEGKMSKIYNVVMKKQDKVLELSQWIVKEIQLTQNRRITFRFGQVLLQEKQTLDFFGLSHGSKINAYIQTDGGF